MANIHAETVINLGLSLEDMEALERVDNILQTIHNFGDDSMILQSAETGECIFFEEFSRTAGIIKGLSMNRCWKIRQK